MAKKKILYISSEIYPYLPESYISNQCRYLPQGIQEKENEIRTFMPKYGCINERKHLLHEVIRLSGQNVIIEDNDHPLIIKVASLQAVRMQIYFIDSEDFFKRKEMFFDENGKFFSDNDSRAIFFAKGVIETVRKLTWNPDIIHCHGWISALVPLFIKIMYKDNPLFQETKIVYSIYNDHFKNKFSSRFRQKLELTGINKKYIAHLKSPGYEQLTKTAIDYSDAVCVAQNDVKTSILNYLANNYSRPVLTHCEDTYESAKNDGWIKLPVDEEAVTQIIKQKNDEDLPFYEIKSFTDKNGKSYKMYKEKEKENVYQAHIDDYDNFYEELLPKDPVWF